MERKLQTFKEGKKKEEDRFWGGGIKSVKQTFETQFAQWGFAAQQSRGTNRQIAELLTH